MQYTSIGLSQYQETDRVSVLEHYNRDMRTTTSYVSGIMQTAENYHQELVAETIARNDGDGELNEKIIRNNTEINLLHDTDAELANKIETEKERITALSSTVETNKNNISDRVDNLENNITNWQTNATNLITTNRTNISNNASKIAALEAGAVEQTSTITSIRSELSSTTTRANENYNSIGNIWTNIGNQNNAIHNIETNISNFNSNLGAVRTQCQSNTARIAVLENTGGIGGADYVPLYFAHDSGYTFADVTINKSNSFEVSDVEKTYIWNFNAPRKEFVCPIILPGTLMPFDSSTLVREFTISPQNAGGSFVSSYTGDGYDTTNIRVFFWFAVYLVDLNMAEFKQLAAKPSLIDYLEPTALNGKKFKLTKNGLLQVDTTNRHLSELYFVGIGYINT